MSSKEQSVKDNGKKGSVPAHLIPEVAQAVLEDAVLTAAADLAATFAEENGVEPDTDDLPFVIEVADDGTIGLDGVPFLGPVRRLALENAGIRTRQHLTEATQEQIGGVKGVGLRNAERIKEWLAEQEAIKSPTNIAVEPPSVSLDPEQAGENQMLYDDLDVIESAVAQIIDAHTKKSLDKKLERQLARILLTIAEVPEALDTLSRKDAKIAAKSVDKIAQLLASMADRGRLSEKKQEALREKVKSRRQELETVLGE